VGLGMAPQPLPEGPAWRACRDVAAADLAGHMDPQDDGHFGTPVRPGLQVAAFGRYLIGVDHNAGLVTSVSRLWLTSASISSDGCKITASVKSRVTLPPVTRTSIRRGTSHGHHASRCCHGIRCGPGPSAPGPVRPGRNLVWPAGPWSAPPARRRCVPSRLPRAARRVLPRSAGHHRPPPAATPPDQPVRRHHRPPECLQPVPRV
jgi:hypothetical protein